MFATLWDKISIGNPRTYRNLTLTPILLKDGPLSSAEPISLEDAFATAQSRSMRSPLRVTCRSCA